ncbi:uncharacterized protein BDW43DRAFT_32314 [Aspergillus alliaceus]|uniref:uncharacterized protein n=1 Tax=Petromyces alliaceus TaxID=209559 RepID=UPI0012A60A48|nr:uncharacterized protein BDW43DRAFT_32314 [Aspergillus alliaceus]KAB8235417.1 hypothetical protein BDW43DRAFT_32314 [Aspergillus alliaceus]
MGTLVRLWSIPLVSSPGLDTVSEVHWLLVAANLTRSRRRTTRDSGHYLHEPWQYRSPHRSLYPSLGLNQNQRQRQARSPYPKLDCLRIRSITTWTISGLKRKRNERRMASTSTAGACTVLLKGIPWNGIGADWEVPFHGIPLSNIELVAAEHVYMSVFDEN